MEESGLFEAMDSQRPCTRWLSIASIMPDGIQTGTPVTTMTSGERVADCIGPCMSCRRITRLFAKSPWREEKVSMGNLA